MTGNDIVTIIDKLAEKLGTTSEQLIEIYTPWVVASAWSFIGIGGGILILCICISVFLWVINEDTRVGACVVLIVGFLLGGLFVFKSVPDLIAPEAAAITKIVGMLH